MSAILNGKDKVIKEQFNQLVGKGYLGEIDIDKKLPEELILKNQELTRHFQEVLRNLRKASNVHEAELIIALSLLHGASFRPDQIVEVLEKKHLTSLDVVFVLAYETVILTRSGHKELSDLDKKVLAKAEEIHQKGIYFVNFSFNHSTAYHMEKITIVDAKGKIVIDEKGKPVTKVDLCPHSHLADKKLLELSKTVQERIKKNTNRLKLNRSSSPYLFGKKDELIPKKPEKKRSTISGASLIAYRLNKQQVFFGSGSSGSSEIRKPTSLTKRGKIDLIFPNKFNQIESNRRSGKTSNKLDNRPLNRFIPTFIGSFHTNRHFSPRNEFKQEPKFILKEKPRSYNLTDFSKRTFRLSVLESSNREETKDKKSRKGDKPRSPNSFYFGKRGVLVLPVGSPNKVVEIGSILRQAFDNRRTSGQKVGLNLKMEEKEEKLTAKENKRSNSVHKVSSELSQEKGTFEKGFTQIGGINMSSTQNTQNPNPINNVKRKRENSLRPSLTKTAQAAIDPNSFDPYVIRSEINRILIDTLGYKGKRRSRVIVQNLTPVNLSIDSLKKILIENIDQLGPVLYIGTRRDRVNRGNKIILSTGDTRKQARQRFRLAKTGNQPKQPGVFCLN